MDFKIGKRKYRLEKVSMYISDLYVEYVRYQNDIITMEADFEGIRLECEIDREEAETKVDKLRAELKMFSQDRELKRNGIQGGIDGGLKRNEILKEIVLLNGYEYDEDDWVRNVSEGQFSELIGELMTSKKKAEET